MSRSFDDDLARAVADGARRVAHAPRASAARAAARRAHVQRDRPAEDGVAERDRELGRRVVVVLVEAAGAAPAPPPEKRSEKRSPKSPDQRKPSPRPGAPPRGAPPRVAANGPAPNGPPRRTRRAGLRRTSGVARLVEVLPALRVLEDLVGRGDLLELLLRGGVAGVHVGVELPREAAVRLLDLGLARLPLDSENLVGILRRHAGRR